MTIWAAEANLALGQMTQARQLLQESLDLPDKATSAHYQRLLGLIIFGKEMVVHGQPADSAHALFERAVAWARSHPGESGWSYGLPEALYFAGEYREARTIFERRLRAHEDDEYAREWAGAAAARLHDTTAARRTDRWFAARQAPGSGGGSAFARARIAAIQGDGAASAARFR